MEIILSAAMSLDGYIDDSSPARLKLSSPGDWDAVERLRASCDVIMVGAGTVRRDNPSLVIRREELRRERIAAGMNPDIDKVVITHSGNLDPCSDFFIRGGGRKLIITDSNIDFPTENALVEVVRLDKVDAFSIAEELLSRGYKRLMVEGGTHILSMMIRERVFDRFRLAVAPVIVGDDTAPRLLLPDIGKISSNGISLLKAEKLGDTAVMEFSNHDRDNKYILMAIAESRRSEPRESCYRVGAVIVTADGKIYKGYTNETGPHNHAEEEAIIKAEKDGASLDGAAIYSSMEPCSTRSSKSKSCSEIIIEKGFAKVFFSLAEPRHFVECQGAKNMIAAGLEVVELSQMAYLAKLINRHILG